MGKVFEQKGDGARRGDLGGERLSLVQLSFGRETGGKLCVIKGLVGSSQKEKLGSID